MTTTGPGQYDLFDRLAEEFAARYRRGERPSLKEYTDRYPELADEIRELFPALVRVEQAEDLLHERRRPRRPRPALPEQVGDYRVLREIGRGGMGVVYEAEQVSLGRRVALKVLPAQGSRDRTAVERFRREARAAARLHHTNIVPVFEVGQDGDVRYYAMQFIAGQGLDAVIDELRRLRGRSRPAARRGAGRRPRGGRTAPTEPGLGVALDLLTGRFVPERPGATAPTADAATEPGSDRHAPGGRPRPGRGPRRRADRPRSSRRPPPRPPARRP